MRSHASVVELLGVPASGKSGLADGLVRALPGTVLVKEHAPRDLPALTLGAARAWPVLLEGPPAGSGRVRWVAWAGRLAAAPSVAARRAATSSGLVVLDQGPAYTLGRMAGVRRTDRGNHWWHRQVFGTASLLDVLVVLDADPDVLSRRLHERPKAHRATVLDDRGTLRYLRREQELCLMVTDALARAGTPVVHLDTGRVPLGQQVAAVREALDASRGPNGRRRR